MDKDSKNTIGSVFGLYGMLDLANRYNQSRMFYVYIMPHYIYDLYSRMIYENDQIFSIFSKYIKEQDDIIGTLIFKIKYKKEDQILEYILSSKDYDETNYTKKSENLRFLGIHDSFIIAELFSVLHTYYVVGGWHNIKKELELSEIISNFPYELIGKYNYLLSDNLFKEHLELLPHLKEKLMDLKYI